jgi:hypothetical protein
MSGRALVRAGAYSKWPICRAKSEDCGGQWHHADPSPRANQAEQYSGDQRQSQHRANGAINPTNVGFHAYFLQVSKSGERRANQQDLPRWFARHHTE